MNISKSFISPNSLDMESIILAFKHIFDKKSRYHFEKLSYNCLNLEKNSVSLKKFSGIFQSFCVLQFFQNQ